MAHFLHNISERRKENTFFGCAGLLGLGCTTGGLEDCLGVRLPAILVAREWGVIVSGPPNPRGRMGFWSKPPARFWKFVLIRKIGSFSHQSSNILNFKFSF